MAEASVRERFLDFLQQRFRTCTRLPASRSLFDVGNGRRIYVRYSKVHPDGRTFYGLRQTDLRQLEGFESLLCFLWDGQREPLLVPYRDFEELFAALRPAADGQFKAQVYPDSTAIELYIANGGRFNVEAYVGWNESNNFAFEDRDRLNQELQHHQVQSLLGAIGARKGYDVWLPLADRMRMDWTLTPQFPMSERVSVNDELENYAREIDVIWMGRGRSDVTALFEVEHSTPVYSGLLRFNDVRLLLPHLQPRFTIVANDSRRSRFAAQINRPTFRASGLVDCCSFLDYANVLEWHANVLGERV